jgi:enoyl-CoA hydratase
MPNAKSTTTVHAGKTDGVTTIRFVTGEGVAIFSSRVMGELGTIVERVAEDAHSRFVVFRGEGKTFLAGADIAEMAHFDEDRGHAFSKHGHNVFDAIESLPQVTIAAINGHALGGGCELALACDFRIAAAAAKLGQPESRLGVIPGWGGTRRLPRIVGPARARRLMFTGENITAEEALRIGLVDEVVPTPENLDPALARWFAALSAGSPAAITRIKRAMLHDDEVDQFGLCFNCSDTKEGLGAFLEKRPPTWAPKGK